MFKYDGSSSEDEQHKVIDSSSIGGRQVLHYNDLEELD